MQRTISVEEGKQLAQEWNCGWIEASARHGLNVARAFELCLEQIEKANSPAPEEKRTCRIS
jgi:Ras homolog enriched in brain